jgi:hypothetical protein
VFEGNGLPEQPEPARAFEEDEEFEAPKKRGLFSRLRRG